MKNSIDLTIEKDCKKISSYNNLDTIENQEINDFISIKDYTFTNRSNKKNIKDTSYLSNKSFSINNENKRERSSEKSDINSENRTLDKSLKVKKNKKIKISNKNKIYIKKRKSEYINKKDNQINKLDIDKKQFKSQSLDNELKQKEIIKEIKDSVICYICLMKITSPRICPNCHKIACEKCLKNWFIEKGNNSCGYCRAKLTFDKMISVPIINDVAKLIDQISLNRTNKILGMKYTRSKKSKSNYNKIININNEKIINNENIVRNSINIEKFSKLRNEKHKIYFDKAQSLICHSTHGPHFIMMDKESKNSSFNNSEEFCQKHPDQPLYYYCLNCNQAYCRTCFVFFGEEKDKHNNHRIIEYQRNILIDLSKICKISNNLDNKCEELNAYIKRCEALKSCYEFERITVQNHIKLFMDNFNKKIDENIKVLDNIINNYKFYLNQIEKGQKDLQKFYTKIINFKSKQKEYDYNLIENLSNICKIKYYNSKEVDGYSDISKNMSLNFYQTKLKKYEIKQNNYHFKLPLDNSKYQLCVILKGNEVQIYIYWPIDKSKDLSYIEKEKNGLLPFIFMRRKNKNWEYFRLEEFLTYKGNNYYIKRFPAHNFCNINSYFKIKAFLYETYLD